jgi:hypothetical protein
MTTSSVHGHQDDRNRCGWWPAHVWTITLDDDVMSIAGRD